MRLIALGAVLALCFQQISCGRKEAPVPPSRPTTTPAHATAPVPDDTAALAELAKLETRARQAVREENHGRITTAAKAMSALSFHEAANAARRDALVAELRGQAAITRDALHRFLFVELRRLPAAQRKALLDSADAGDEDAVARSAAALADAEFTAGRRYLRATDTLKPRTTDPATGLRVRTAGDVKRAWPNAFNRAFNDRMRKRTHPR